MAQKSLFPHNNLEWSIRNNLARYEADTTNVRLRLNLATMYLSSGLFHEGGEAHCTEALKLARKQLKEDPASDVGRLIAALAYLGKDRPESASQILAELEEDMSEGSMFQLAKGLLHRSLGDMNSMLQALETACHLSPEAWEPHLQLGQEQLRLAEAQGSFFLIEQAQYHLIQAIRLDENAANNAGLIHDLAITCHIIGRYSEAERYFQRLLHVPSYEARARKRLGQIAYRLHKYNNALNHLRKYLQMQPDDSEALAKLGLCYFNLEQYDRAREVCRRAILIDSYNHTARHTMGRTLLAKGLDKEAHRVFRENLDMFPEHIPTYRYLVDLRSSGDQSWLEKALFAEVPVYTLQPVSPDQDDRAMTRSRIEILINRMYDDGSQWLNSILRSIHYTQDEWLRFYLWQAACDLISSEKQREILSKLSAAGVYFSKDLGQDAIVVADQLSSTELLNAMEITQEDFKRAASERYTPAHDVAEHRKRLEKERQKARNYQALMLLALALKEAENQSLAGDLLKEWASNTEDEDMAIVAHLGLAISGDRNALKFIQKQIKTKTQAELFRRVAGQFTSQPTVNPQLFEVQDQQQTCNCCGNSENKLKKEEPNKVKNFVLLSGGSSRVCSHCIADLWLTRETLEQPLDSICALCGNTNLDVYSVYLYKGMEVCHSCILYAMGTEQRRDLDAFFQSQR